MKKHIANIITGSRIVLSLNKVTGLLLFLLPVTISFVDLTYTLPIVCAIATVAAMHEVYFTYSEKKHDT